MLKSQFSPLSFRPAFSFAILFPSLPFLPPHFVSLYSVFHFLSFFLSSWRSARSGHSFPMSPVFFLVVCLSCTDVFHFFLPFKIVLGSPSVLLISPVFFILVCLSLYKRTFQRFLSFRLALSFRSFQVFLPVSACFLPSRLPIIIHRIFSSSEFSFCLHAHSFSVPVLPFHSPVFFILICSMIIMQRILFF